MSSPSLPHTTIGIVGAGFTGIATACHLMRLAGDINVSIQVVLIGEPKSFGGGLAYRVEDDNLILNVPVGNMSLFPDRPDDFLRFCNEIDGAWVSGSFVSRRLYGQYLESSLAVARHGTSAALIEIRDEVVDIVAEPRGFRLELLGHAPVHADRVVLALGHLPSALPLGLSTAGSGGADSRPHPCVIDAWDAPALHRLSPEHPVLVLGTGHTAVDTAFRLISMAPERKVVMLSRHGRIPAGHRKADEFVRLPKLKDAVEKEVRETLLSAPTARALVSRLRELVAMHTAEGVDWRDVINSLRAITPEIWQSLASRERARFRRHLVNFWDPVRHRLAPVAARRLLRLTESRRVEVLAGRVRQIEGVPGEAIWKMTVAPRGANKTLELHVGAIVNCTGSNFDVTRSDSTLIKNLLKSGLLQPDEGGLGLLVDGQYRCSAHPGLHYVGPMLRSFYWESTAVPELRKHASALAAQLLDVDPDSHGSRTGRSQAAANQREFAR